MGPGAPVGVGKVNPFAGIVDFLSAEHKLSRRLSSRLLKMMHRLWYQATVAQAAHQRVDRLLQSLVDGTGL